MKKMLIEKLDSFAAAPFTIQRISELLSDPRKQYSRIDKFMRAVEKTILVVSTVPPGRHRSESENGDSLDSALNGDFATEVNVDIDMEQDGNFTKELSVATNRKEPNHEASEAQKESVTIKKNVSPVKEDVAGTSESADEKSQNDKVVKDSEVTTTTAATEPKKELTAEPETTEKLTAQDKIDEQPNKSDIPTSPRTDDTLPTSKPVLDEVLSNEPIRSAENEILIDTTEIISQTTPLAALENIVAVRTEPVADASEQIEQKAPTDVETTEPETKTSTEPVSQASTSPVKDDSESEPKRLKITESLETSELESKIEVEPVSQQDEQSVPAEKSLEDPVEVSVSTKAPVEEQIPTIIPEEASVETSVSFTAPVEEEKIDEPIPEIAEIPIEIVPPAEDIAEAPLTEMETVQTVSENKMSLDEDEPPAIELEMTPVANKMDTDEADAAPMDFEDSSNEPMDQ